jgi:hypothetical protein
MQSEPKQCSGQRKGTRSSGLAQAFREAAKALSPTKKPPRARRACKSDKRIYVAFTGILGTAADRQVSIQKEMKSRIGHSNSHIIFVDSFIQAVHELGGTIIHDVIEDYPKITHLVVTDGESSIKPRRMKFFVGLCITPNIVGTEWIHQSKLRGSFLPVDAFRIADDKDVVETNDFFFSVK